MSDQKPRLWHPNWPTYDPAVGAYRLEPPVSDLVSALELSSDSPDPGDVLAIERYAVSYHGLTWKPGDKGGSELEMQILGRLTDGQWFTVEAWNDYTGWGCGEASDVRVSDTRDAAIAELTQDARYALGIMPRPEDEGLFR